jgi:selenocysteine lyase/cysteine desulfurase
LNDLLVDGLDELGARVVTPRSADHRGALTCIASTDVDALVALMTSRGIVTSSRDDNLRISPHCYNTAEDIEAVLGVLRENRELLAPLHP